MSEFHSSVFEIWRVKNGPKIAQNPLQTPVNSKLAGWIQQAFCTKTFLFPLRIFWHQFHLSTWKSPFRDSGVPLPHPTRRLPAPNPITRLCPNRSQWNLARFYGMLRPRCLPNFIEIDWENERVIRVQSAQTAFLGTPKKRFNRYISRVTRSSRAVFLR